MTDSNDLAVHAVAQLAGSFDSRSARSAVAPQKPGFERGATILVPAANAMGAGSAGSEAPTRPILSVARRSGDATIGGATRSATEAPFARNGRQDYVGLAR